MHDLNGWTIFLLEVLEFDILKTLQFENDVNIRFGLQWHILNFNYNDIKALNNFFFFTLII